MTTHIHDNVILSISRLFLAFWRGLFIVLLFFAPSPFIIRAEPQSGAQVPSPHRHQAVAHLNAKTRDPNKGDCPSHNRLPGFTMQCKECHFQHTAQTATPAGLSIAHSKVCVAHLKYLSLAARTWATNHQGALPADFLSISNELRSPKMLYCLADHERRPPADWTEVTPQRASYIIQPTTAPDAAYVRCRIHGHRLLRDGRVVPEE